MIKEKMSLPTQHKHTPIQDSEYKTQQVKL